MDSLIAREILAAVISLDQGLGEIDRLISGVSDEEERKIWIERLGNVLRAINDQMIIPLVAKFPELDAIAHG